MSKLKNENLIYKNRFWLLFFSFALLYSFVVINRFIPWSAQGNAIEFFSVDYSYGFATKLLPGAIFHLLFGKNASKKELDIFMSVVLALIFLGVSYLLQRFIFHVPDNFKKRAVILVLIYLSGAYTFAVFTRTIGMLDTFWLLFVILFFLFLERKFLRFLIPLLYLGCVLVHESSINSYLILMSIVLLYRISIEENKSEKRKFLVIFILSLVAGIGSFLFFSVFESKMICSMEDFHQKLIEHGCTDFYYYDYAFYGNYSGTQYIPQWVFSVNSSFLKFIYFIYYRFKLNINIISMSSTRHLLSFCCGVLILAPFVFLLIRIHLKRFQKKKNSLHRFCSLLMVIQFPFTFLTAMPFSEDFTRWFSHSFLIAFTLLLAVLYYEQETLKKFMPEFNRLCHTLYFKIHCLTYVLFSILTVS